MAKTEIRLDGGKKLKEYMDKLGKKLGSKESVSVGFLSGATYPTGISAKTLRSMYKKIKAKGITAPLRGSKGGQTVAEVAAINEFGNPAKGQEPRPFFRRMIAKESPHWGEDMLKALQHTNMDTGHAMQLMGEKIAGELRQSITDLVAPPLKESTIKAKGFSKPLIDTGHMLASVDYEVN